MPRIVSRVSALRAAIAVAIALLVVASAPLAIAASYDELVAQAKQRPADVDYAALRQAYAESDRYDGYNTDLVALRAPLLKAYADGNCDTVLKQGQAILEKNYVFLDAHFMLSACYRKLGQIAESERHVAATRGLAQAILASGDGKTPATVFVVISVAEEYSVIGIQGARRIQQALIAEGGHNYDVITVQTRAGATEQVYFNIDRVMRWSADKFGKK